MAWRVGSGDQVGVRRAHHRYQQLQPNAKRRAGCLVLCSVGAAYGLFAARNDGKRVCALALKLGAGGWWRAGVRMARNGVLGWSNRVSGGVRLGDRGTL